MTWSTDPRYAADDETVKRVARGKTFATFYCPDNLGGMDTSLPTNYFDGCM